MECAADREKKQPDNDFTILFWLFVTFLFYFYFFSFVFLMYFLLYLFVRPFSDGVFFQFDVVFITLFAAMVCQKQGGPERRPEGLAT